NQPGPQFTVQSPNPKVQELKSEASDFELRPSDFAPSSSCSPSSSSSSSIPAPARPAIAPSDGGSLMKAHSSRHSSERRRITPHASSIRVPALNVKGLTARTKETILRERARGEFTSLTDFIFRVRPLDEEMESLIQTGAFDEFGKPRSAQYWEFKQEAAGR